MRASMLIRWSGMALIVGGGCVVLARLFQVALFGDQPLSIQAASDAFVPALGIPGLLGSILPLVGIVGLYARQAHKAGVFGFLTFALAFLGQSLALGANWTYAFAAPLLHDLNPALLDTAFADPAWGPLGPAFMVSYPVAIVGTVLLGISTWFTAVLPRWASGVWIVSLVLAAVLPLSVLGMPGILLNLLMSAGLVAVGYALWTEKGAPS